MSDVKAFSRAAIAASGLCVAGQAACAGSLTYTSQTRTILAHAAGVPDQSASAPDFTAFNGSVSAMAPSGTNGSATQVSQLMPSGVTMSGYLSGLTKDGFGPFGYGQSSLQTSFTLDAASPYTIDIGFRGGVISVGSEYNCRLTDVSTNQTLFTAGGPYSSGPALPYSGTLPAGSYTLNFFAIHQPYNGNTSASGNYSASFTVTPEPTSLGLFAVGVGLLCRRRPGRAATT